MFFEGYVTVLRAGLFYIYIVLPCFCFELLFFTMIDLISVWTAQPHLPGLYVYYETGSKDPVLLWMVLCLCHVCLIRKHVFLRDAAP